MSTESRGSAYRVIGEVEDDQGKGYVLKLRGSDTTFDEIKTRWVTELTKSLNKLHKPTEAPVEYYFISAAVHDSVGDEGLPHIATIGVFIPHGVDRDDVLAHLKQVWGPETHFV